VQVESLTGKASAVRANQDFLTGNQDFARGRMRAVTGMRVGGGVDRFNALPVSVFTGAPSRGCLPVSLCPDTRCRGYNAPPAKDRQRLRARQGLAVGLVSEQIGLVLRHVVGKLRRAVTATAKAVREALRQRPCSIIGGLAADLLRSHVELVAENVLLRQQLIVAARKVKRPVFQPHERGLITLLAAILPRWRDALLVVKPETVLRWHREGFRLLWRWKSRSTMPPTPRVSPDLVELIRRMAAENRLWGAERIRGELLTLGIHVAKRTVQRYMPDRRNPAPPRGQSWHTFLHNHTAWACDFPQTYDVWFRPIFAFFIVDINTKQVVHVGVTRHPTAQWTAQQLREVTPFGAGPQLIIRDNDGKFGADFDRAAKGAGVRVLRTAVQAPLMNSVCERFLGSVRRECLDHIVVLGERHLEYMLKEYCFNYFNVARPHQGIGQRLPTEPAFTASADPAIVVGVPVLGGLHHDYRAVA
jgi:putative transposase